MKIAKLFLGGSIKPPEGNLRGTIPEIIPSTQATIGSPFLILEAPIRSMSPVAFLFAPDGKGGGYFNSLMIHIPLSWKEVVESTGAMDPNAIVVEDPPLAWQLILKHAVRYWQPFLKEGIPFEQFTEVWLKYPDMYKGYVDKRKNPGPTSRQNSFIIIRWHTWERRQATSEERAADMQANGCGGLTARSLEKRAHRLGLRSNS